MDAVSAGGYTNVIWVGDRKALPHQLNGKSSNINHMVLRKMYPDVKETSQVCLSRVTTTVSRLEFVKLGTICTSSLCLLSVYRHAETVKFARAIDL